MSKGIAASTPAQFGYYNAKTLLNSDGHLLKCPMCPNEEPLDWEKKTAQTGTKMFTWKCSDCGFGTAAFIKEKCEFSLKANLVENCAKAGLGVHELSAYMKKFGLGSIPKKTLDDYYAGGLGLAIVTKKRKIEEIEEDTSDSQFSSKKFFSESASDILAQILEHVKVIKEVNEVQKDELRDLIVAVKLQGANALESTTKVVDLLQENSFKLNNLATPPKIEDMTDEDEARLKALFDSNEICATVDYNLIDEESVQVIPPKSSQLKRAKTIKPRQNSKQ